MEFTLVFERSNENRGGNYNLVFEPCPIWSINNEWILNLNPENPQYQAGSLKRLIEKEGLEGVKSCIVVVHDYGYGGVEDLAVIEKELVEQRIKYKVISFGEL